MAMGDKPLMSVNDAARMFRVHPRTVRGWIDRGLLPVIRTPTGRIRVSYMEVARLMYGIEETEPGQ